MFLSVFHMLGAILVAALVAITPLHAEEVEYWGDDDLPSSGVRQFRLNDQKIPKGSQCEQILMAAEQELGRPLTFEEIKESLPAILKATGEALESDSKPFCFTASMRVLTPRGDIPIGQLRVNDEVISIDLTTFNPVVNRIRAISVRDNVDYGRLSDLARPLEVTPREPFYAQAGTHPPAFTPIEELRESDHLFRAQARAPAVLTPVRRGCFQFPVGTTTVFNLQLFGEPRNFIVEGILVHNVLFMKF